ncbi:MAG TPA: protein kinase [Sandaracinaceae bacterium LLY-WYZ-13_1]|nr:protein kinase [Sandaracinaceae bacterium LLY-WYZ-13_1]
MNATTDILRGELERLFELDELKTLSDELLGFDPEQVGGTEGKGAFARALVQRCEDDDALLALTDAVLLSKEGVNDKVRAVFDAEPGEELKPGSEVAGFRILKKLGEGGVGVVYLGERKTDDEKVRAAIKVVRPVHARDRAAARRWQTVARVHRGLESRSLAPILGVGTLDDGRPWVATQFVEGQALSARIGRTGPMHYNEARPIVRGVLEALELLHERGLVHGDVKAENVFMVRPSASDKMKNEPTGVLVDAGVDRLFGRTAVAVSQTGLLPVFGTPKAIAPELARGAGATASSDLYAAGCLLYEALTGRPPFEGETAIDVVAQHLASEPEPPSAHAPRGWVAKELDGIVLRAIAKDPTDRYADAAAFREALESIGRASIPPAAREKKDLDEKAFDEAAKALKEKPAEEERAVALERVVEPAQAWEKAVEVMTEAVEKADDDEAKKALWYRIARIQEADLEDHEGAEASYRQILELDDDEEIARAAIEELKRASGDSEGLVELLLEKVETEESAEERGAILREIAETYEKQLKDRENAFVAWVQALAEDPRHRESATEVERLAGDDADNWNEAVGALNETLEALEDDDEKVPLYVLLGRWYADKLNRPDFAVPCYGQALALDPSNDAAMEGTIELYRKAQSWQELATMLLQRAESAGNPAKARDWKAEAAEVVHRKLNDPTRAAEIFEQILKDDPAHPRATEALEGIYAERKEWKPLVELLETKAKSQRGEERAGTLCAIAEIYEDRLDDLDQAAAHYEAALKHDDKDVGALKGLERIYARTEKYEPLLANLERQLEVAATPRQKIALYERMGSIQLEEFVDQEKAESLYAAVVEIEPGHEGANTALARIYRKLQRFDDLAATLERHALGSEDEDRKIELLLQAARVLMADVGAPDRALGMVERVTALHPEHTEALELASRLQAQTGDAAKALEATERLAEAEKDAEKKAELFVRAGRILEDKGDNDGAIERYKRALDAHPENTRAAGALRSIYASRGDAHGAADLLRREIEMTEGAISKAKLHAELGELVRDRMDDSTRAVEAFEKALELDPTCTPAARGLGDMAFERSDWEETVRYYEPLLARTSEMAADVARDVSVRCGDAFRKLEQYDKAQRAYLNAKAFARDDREVLERVAEVTFDMGAPDEAAELYRDLIDQFGSDLVGGDKGRVLWRFGESLRQAEDRDAARKALNEAAELMPDDPAPLTSLKKLYEDEGKWDEVVRTLRRRMEAAGDDERFDLLVEAGDVLMQKVGDKAKASKSYVAALEIKGDDRNLLTKLMAVYSESKDWSRLVEVILRIAELVDDPAQLAKYYHTAAAISHFELNRLEEASDYYEQALEHDASMLKSFEGLVTALNSQADWDRLEEVYRNRLKRLGEDADPKDRAHLWDQLGELLLHRLEQKSDAMEALEEAQKLDPGNRRRAEQLAEVYSSEPKRYFQKAVRVHGDLLSINPYRIESYQALRKLYTEAKKPDESWCACQALTVLKNAEPDEESFFKKHRTREPAAATETMSKKDWGELLVHPDQDPLLTDIFATIAPAVIATRSQPLSRFDLDASQKIDPANDEAAMARTLHYASGVTGIDLPDVFYREDDPGGLSFVFSDPPGIGLGKGALAKSPPKALAFVAGRHLSYLRAGHYLRMLVPTGSGLRAWLLAAIKTAVGHFPVPKELAGSVDEHLGAFKQHLPGPQQERLRSLVQKLLQAAPELDLKKWVAAVDLTADRVGFVLANDLELATAVVKASPEEAAGVAQKERLKELQIYSVSEPYLTLRHHLGIAIGD